jgi:SAM-dependent methyltransferase
MEPAERFARRTHEAEAMDAPGVSWEDFSGSLDEIRLVNRFLGGARAAGLALDALFAPDFPSEIRLLDLGTGAADIPLALQEWARRRRLRLHVTALDLSAHALRYARRLKGGAENLSLLRGDALRAPFRPGSFDVVTAAMFLHHFPREKAAEMISAMWALARRGIAVNDLYRGRVPYHTIRMLTALFSKNALVREDAPASVLNGFREGDARELASLAGIPLRCRRFFPYRLVMWAKKNP